MFEIRSNLAKLLATENITVRVSPDLTTAQFDTKNRILEMPEWTGISVDLHDMLIVHEVGHALDTDPTMWMKAIDDISSKYTNQDVMHNSAIKSAVKDFLNVIEDARIDKRQKRRYPGSKRNYTAGLKELQERNFFGVQDTNINELSFIDRANLYFKGFPHVRFANDTERAYIARMSDLETFDEVATLAAEVFEYASKISSIQAKTVMSVKMDLSDDANDDEDANGVGDSFESDEDDEDGDTGSSNEKSDEDDGDDGDDGDEGEEGEGKDGVKTNNTSDIPRSLTMESSNKNAQEMVHNNNFCYTYVDVPEIVDNLSKNVHDFSRVIPEMEASSVNLYGDVHAAKNIAAREVVAWRKAEKNTLSYMIKEFEMKKSADAYIRTAISKTGIIDTNKLHTYKYNEDLFLRQNIVPTGKNHGFFLLLDWSGSMNGPQLRETMKQLFSLVLFCKMVQVPFEVYLFKSRGPEPLKMSKNRNTYVQINGFTLRNILSSRMNSSMFQRALNILWFASRYNLHSDIMSSTPLNGAILMSEPLINEFRNRNKLQIVSTIILTDGDSDYFAIQGRNYEPGKIGKVYMKDPKTQKSYDITDVQKQTSVLLSILKDRTGINVLGFYLYNGPLKRLNKLSEANKQSETIEKQWTEDKYIALTTFGFDEYYIINNRNRDRNEEELAVDASMSKSRAIKMFSKFYASKMYSRTLLSRFIDRVASDRYIQKRA